VVESSALLKRRSPKGYRGFESLPHRVPSSGDLIPTSKLRANWRESVIEDVIAHAATEGDPLDFVEGPMDAKINAALSILFFCF
jgi:hypothetical protein